jgi:hypothetical protein
MAMHLHNGKCLRVAGGVEAIAPGASECGRGDTKEKAVWGLCFEHASI